MAQASVPTGSEIRAVTRPPDMPIAAGLATPLARGVVRNNPIDFANPNPRKTGRFEMVKARTKKELFLHTRGPGVLAEGG